MRKFMDNDFLLYSDLAKDLYHNYAAKMPIYDYHNHLSPKEIYEDIKFETITDAWLKFDHYKWRLLRSNGVLEENITGSADKYTKFLEYAKTIEYAIGNPLHHWSHLELQRYFDIDLVLNEENAKIIYDKTNEKLNKSEFSARNLLRMQNVYALCTTDDPKDSLEYHIKLKDEFEVKVLPSFRPDNLVHIEKPAFIPYVETFEKELNVKLDSIDDVVNNLIKRLHFFKEVGCLVSDHGLDEILYLESTKEEANEVFLKGKKGATLTRDELRKYKGYILNILGKEYAKLGMVMQLHIGPMRNNNTAMFNKLGADAGFDSLNDGLVAVDLSRYLDSLAKDGLLPKTILYCLNPKDNEVLATMLGNFQEGPTKSKIQFGSGWWFNDQYDGMLKQLTALQSLGMLSNFVGMLTDSRSLLSLTRHEYFRRILCNHVAEQVVLGQFPHDMKVLSKIIENICFNNIKNYIES